MVKLIIWLLMKMVLLVFVIDPLDSGKYTLEFIVPASKILSSVSNSSTLTINKAKDFKSRY